MELTPAEIVSASDGVVTGAVPVPLIAVCPARSCEPVAELETLPAGEFGTVESCPNVEFAETTCPLTSFNIPLD
jgi:hypothetical protein